MTAAELLEQFADLESRIAVIYERFSTEFRDTASVGDLWASMGREELHHADRLSRTAGDLANVALGRALVDHLAALQTFVLECERQVSRPIALQEALRITAQLESAEAQHLHDALAAEVWAKALMDDPAMQHRGRALLEHAIRLFGTPQLQPLLSRRFRD